MLCLCCCFFFLDRSVSVSCCDNSELFTLPADNMNDGGAGYLTAATTELTAAMAKEKEGEFSAAIVKYRTAVDILITGVKGKKLLLLTTA